MEAPVVQGNRLSPQQQRLWQVQQGRGIFFSQIAVRIEGELRPEPLARALEELVERHEILRTVYRAAAGAPWPIQMVLDQGAPVLEEVDLRDCDPAQQRVRVADLLAGLRRRDLDLTAAPVLLLSLVRLGDELHVLLASVPSLSADAWTLRNLMHQLSAGYDRQVSGAEEADAPELTQYLQFSEWQLQLLEDNEAPSGMAMWRRRPVGAAPLPFESERAPGRRSGEPAAWPLAISPELAGAAQRLAFSRAAAASAVLLAVWQALLARFTESREVVVAVAFEGRKYRELHDSFGLFAKWLPVHIELDPGVRFEEALSRVQGSLEEAGSWEEYFLLTNGDIARAGFVFTEWPADAAGGGLSFSAEGLRVEDEPVRLTLACRSREGRLDLSLLYDPEAFAPEAVSYLADRYAALLADALEHPAQVVGELDILGAAERRRLLGEWSGGGMEAPVSGAIHELCARQAARTPQATAVTCGGEHLTYGELEARANQVARALLRRGVLPEQPVGVMLERSLALVVSLLGILKAGCAYVPFDPSLPQERLDFLCADSLGEPALVVTADRFADRFQGQSVLRVDGEAASIAAERADAPELSCDTDAVAYVIYTSGSTGRPKGVAVTHANVVRLFSATADRFAYGPGDVWPLFHSYAFDLSVWEIFGALFHGGRVVVVPYEVSRLPDSFHALLARERVTVLTQTPAAFIQLIAAEESGVATEELALRLVIFAGEALNPASLAPWMARHGDEVPELINMYGITETTVHTTIYRMTRADLADPARSPIGRSIDDTRLYVLDAALHPVPMSAVGELYVGGPSLARCYLGRPDLTAARFVPDMASGEAGGRLYRSGDLVRFRADGNLEYLGRMDNQVKVRGFRVELGEIEAALQGLSEVHQTAVLAQKDEPGGAYLVAYLVPERGATLPAIADLRARLLALLPDFMVPSVFVPVESFPLTPNGKIDRRVLLTQRASRFTPETAYVAPESELERTVAAIWAEVLRVERVGLYDNFFDLGGHSLLMVQIFSRIKARIDTELVMIELFEFPTVSSMVKRLVQERERAVPPELTSGRAEARLETLHQLDEDGPAAARLNSRRSLENV